MASSTARGTAASRNWLDWSTLDWKHSTHFCHSKQPTVVRVRTPGYQSKEFWPFGTSDFFLEPPPSTLPHYTHTFPPSNWDHAFWCHHTYFLLQNTDICFKQLKTITFKNPAIFPDFHKINLYVIIMTYVHTHTLAPTDSQMWHAWSPQWLPVQRRGRQQRALCGKPGPDGVCTTTKTSQYYSTVLDKHVESDTISQLHYYQ